MQAHRKLSPRNTATPPSTMLKMFIVAANHSVNWSRTLPWRSEAGM